MRKLKNFIIRLYQDTVFRCIFGRGGMECYLIGLLNAIFLQLNFSLIKNLTIKNPYQLPTNAKRKISILDVFVEDENGRKIDVEMQTHEQEFFNKRVIYYAAQNYVDQVRKGKKYGELRPSFVVALVRFPIPDRPDDCWVDFQQMNSPLYPEVRYDDITIIYVRIPDKPGMRIPRKIGRQLRDWMRYLGSDVTPKSVVREIKTRDATIRELDEEVKRFTLTEDGQMAINQEERYRLDRAEQRRFIAKKAHKEGMDEGEVKGMVKSIRGVLQVRFPGDFTDAFQPWQTKLSEKSLPDLNSLLPLSASCASLSEFTQKL